MDTECVCVSVCVRVHVPPCIEVDGEIKVGIGKYNSFGMRFHLELRELCSGQHLTESVELTKTI